MTSANIEKLKKIMEKLHSNNKLFNDTLQSMIEDAVVREHIPVEYIDRLMYIYQDYCELIG
jgi:hypothetical protein